MSSSYAILSEKELEDTVGGCDDLRRVCHDYTYTIRYWIPLSCDDNNFCVGGYYVTETVTETMCHEICV